MEKQPRRSSVDTRAAILRAARNRFVADGYERATIRVIAADAGIDPAMVMRYFGTKEGLFAAAVEPRLGIPDLTEWPREEAGRRLAEFFVERWDSDDSIVALLRAAASNEPTAIGRMRDVFVRQVAPAIARFCADPAQAPARAALVASQVLGMALCRHVLRVPPAVGLTKEELVEWLGPTFQRYLAD